MGLAKRGNCGQTVGYANTRKLRAVPRCIVPNLLPPRGGPAGVGRCGRPNPAPAPPAGAERGPAQVGGRGSNSTTWRGCRPQIGSTPSRGQMGSGWNCVAGQAGSAG